MDRGLKRIPPTPDLHPHPHARPDRQQRRAPLCHGLSHRLHHTWEGTHWQQRETRSRGRGVNGVRPQGQRRGPYTTHSLSRLLSVSLRSHYLQPGTMSRVTDPQSVDSEVDHVSRVPASPVVTPSQLGSLPEGERQERLCGGT